METNTENTAQAPQNKKMNPLIIVAIVALIAVAIVALMPKNNTENTGTSDQMTAEEPTATSASQATASPAVEAAGTEGVQTINLEAGSFYYSQKEIRVKQGDKVKIVMTSKDMMHDFNIDELSVKSPITRAGETTTVEFTADKEGTFEYYCSVGQHRANGQVGQLIVE